MLANEWQFDGLVGPTHNYAGLALGNLAAASNAGLVSNPRAAALQGLEKMKFVHNLGAKQAFLPPHYRPLVSQLERLGFKGKLGTILQQAYEASPGLLASVFSSSFMWTANAATVSPASDTDGKLHITPANLVSHYHRSVESGFGTKLMRTIFHNDKLFMVHDALPSVLSMGDEGAANHMRLANNHGSEAYNIFVYGSGYDKSSLPRKFPARQDRTASESVARLHRLSADKTLYLQQKPEIIDQGVFHNDVIAMNTTSLMIVHSDSFIPDDQKLLQSLFANNPSWRYRQVSSAELPVKEAVSTYLFNSELLEIGDKNFILVAPSECMKSAACVEIIHKLIDEELLQTVHYLDVRESMRNGGGPACLRLRIVLTPEQEEALHQGVVFNDHKYTQLKQWVEKHYRDRLSFEDMKDPEFVHELDTAYAELESILAMPGLYKEWRI